MTTNSYEEIVRTLLTLSRGQTSRERGFSINESLSWSVVLPLSLMFETSPLAMAARVRVPLREHRPKLSYLRASN